MTRGLDVVGKTAMIICLVSLLPMFVMVVVGAPKVDFSRLAQLPEGGRSLLGQGQWIGSQAI